VEPETIEHDGQDQRVHQLAGKCHPADRRESQRQAAEKPPINECHDQPDVTERDENTAEVIQQVAVPEHSQKG
jgi:hypothetical protein